MHGFELKLKTEQTLNKGVNHCCETKIPQTTQHLLSKCPSTVAFTNEAVKKLDDELKEESGGTIRFEDLWKPPNSKIVMPSRQTLMYWLLMGYLPRHIAVAADKFANINNQHRFAKVKALHKLVVRMALDLHNAIAFIRKTQNRILFTRRKEAAKTLLSQDTFIDEEEEAEQMQNAQDSDGEEDDSSFQPESETPHSDSDDDWSGLCASEKSFVNSE